MAPDTALVLGGVAMRPDEMTLNNYALPGTVDLDYVAVCLAEQIVRIRISATHYARHGDASGLLARPLYAVAATLGIEMRVEEMVDEAMPRVA